MKQHTNSASREICVIKLTVVDVQISIRWVRVSQVQLNIFSLILEWNACMSAGALMQQLTHKVLVMFPVSTTTSLLENVYRIINQRGRETFVLQAKLTPKYISLFVSYIKRTLLIVFVNKVVNIIRPYLLCRPTECADLDQVIIVLIFVRMVTFVNLFSMMIT